MYFGPGIYSDAWDDEDKWRFTVTKTTVTTSAAVTGSRLLMEIHPRRIKLLGDERAIAPLKQPDIVNKSFRLRGRLDTHSKAFRLRMAEEVIEEKRPEKEKKVMKKWL